jgi:hypothetical protein
MVGPVQFDAALVRDRLEFGVAEDLVFADDREGPQRQVAEDHPVACATPFAAGQAAQPVSFSAGKMANAGGVELN